MLNLLHVSAFLAVVDAGSFHSAARRLGVAQPTVSQHVRRLEEALGSVLLVRGRGHCVPTASGAMLLPSARSLMVTAARAVQRGVAQPVLLGASSNAGIYMLQPYLKRIGDLGGGEGIRIDLVIGANPEILGKLEAGEVDLAVTEWWDDRPGFVSRLWRREKLVVIVAPDHPWAARSEISIDELVAAPLLGGERGTGTGTLLRRALGDEVAGRLRVGRNLGSTEAVKHAVRAGLGVSLVAEASVIDEIHWGRLRTVGVTGVELTKEFYVITPLGLPPESRVAKVAEGLGSE